MEHKGPTPQSVVYRNIQQVMNKISFPVIIPNTYDSSGILDRNLVNTGRTPFFEPEEGGSCTSRLPVASFVDMIKKRVPFNLINRYDAEAILLILEEYIKALEERGIRDVNTKLVEGKMMSAYYKDCCNARAHFNTLAKDYSNIRKNNDPNYQLTMEDILNGLTVGGSD